jgi:cytochrome c oxidase cbb3-type subunit III
VIRGGVALLLVLALPACEREEREPRPEQAATEQPDAVALSPLRPGADDPAPAARMGERYERSAWHVSEGKRLYTWFNCAGCHAHGGGGMGPALMDDKWIYGGEIQQIAATILQGRPNGMPGFRGRIPEEQVWQLAAYVRSMGRSVRQDVAPARDDDMQVKPAENRMPYVEPGSGAQPEGARRPQ